MSFRVPGHPTAVASLPPFSVLRISLLCSSLFKSFRALCALDHEPSLLHRTLADARGLALPAPVSVATQKVAKGNSSESQKKLFQNRSWNGSERCSAPSLRGGKALYHSFFRESVMKCSRCEADTELFVHTIPLCPRCANELEQEIPLLGFHLRLRIRSERKRLNGDKHLTLSRYRFKIKAFIRILRASRKRADPLYQFGKAKSL